MQNYLSKFAYLSTMFEGPGDCFSEMQVSLMGRISKLPTKAKNNVQIHNFPICLYFDYLYYIFVFVIRIHIYILSNKYQCKNDINCSTLFIALKCMVM